MFRHQLLTSPALKRYVEGALLYQANIGSTCQSAFVSCRIFHFIEPWGASCGNFIQYLSRRHGYQLSDMSLFLYHTYHSLHLEVHLFMSFLMARWWRVRRGMHVGFLLPYHLSAWVIQSGTVCLVWTWTFLLLFGVCRWETFLIYSHFFCSSNKSYLSPL